MTRQIDSIIVHCSDSEWGTAREIKKWHTDAPPTGRGFSDIGYHFVIQNGRPTPHQELPALNGSIECGRPIDEDNVIGPDETGIHCLGYNDRSIGVCLIGVKRFTLEQFDALKHLLLDLCRQHNIPADGVLGHYETESGKAQGKTCPNFSVLDFRMWLGGRI